MPATGPNCRQSRDRKGAVNRSGALSAALLFLAICPLFAEEPNEAVKRAATALGSGNVKEFVAAFDPSTPGLAQIRAQATELMQQTDAQSNIEFQAESGDNSSRTIPMNWELRIAENGASKAVIRRQSKVTCRVETRGGQWRIVSLEPRDFFRLPHVEGAWNLLETAAASLSNGNPTGFLTAFSKSMPGYDRLANGAASLVMQGEVHSSISLVQNEGTDTSRTLNVDWALSVVSDESQIRRGQREDIVICQVELQGKHWRITAVKPVEFFSAVSLTAHHGKGGGGLLDRQLKGDGLMRGNIRSGDADRSQTPSADVR